MWTVGARDREAAREARGLSKSEMTQLDRAAVLLRTEGLSGKSNAELDVWIKTRADLLQKRRESGTSSSLRFHFEIS